MRLIVAVLCMLGAMPLAAQDFAIDAHLIDRCLPIQDDPMHCVGREAAACIERNGAGPEMVIAACKELARMAGLEMAKLEMADLEMGDLEMGDLEMGR